MSSLNPLISRLEVLEKELTPASATVDADKDVDEFTRLKKTCATQVADIRQLITERDELLEAKQMGTKETVEMSAKVRQQLRALKDNANRLKDLQQAADEKAKKKRKGPAGPPDQRAEVVDLVFKHMGECEALEKRRFTANSAAAAAGAGVGKSDLMSKGVKRTAEFTDLKNLDDPELDAGLKMLAAKDAELDKELDDISRGVNVLKNIALDMQQEVKLQTVMVDEITNKVDDATLHLQDLNKKIGEVLDQAGGATGIIIKVVLLILVLAVVVYAIKLVQD